LWVKCGVLLHKKIIAYVASNDYVKIKKREVDFDREETCLLVKKGGLSYRKKNKAMAAERCLPYYQPWKSEIHFIS
jgi:hypothetical protein